MHFSPATNFDSTASCSRCKMVPKITIHAACVADRSKHTSRTMPQHQARCTWKAEVQGRIGKTNSLLPTAGSIGPPYTKKESPEEVPLDCRSKNQSVSIAEKMLEFGQGTFVEFRGNLLGSPHCWIWSDRQLWKCSV